ncbi:MAG: DUF2914 domain-containing protein [Candidatus Wildermuthbacteria bacterium]|nr:DUF2914 domain-containing protein [Candidatus Wildermuthbacteria bacterium]
MLKRFTTAGFAKIKSWYAKYERWLIPGSLLAGVIGDVATFRFIDISLALSLLGFYLISSLGVIAYMHAYDEGVFGGERKPFMYARLFSPLALQVAFGGLLSGFLIFYGFSGSLWVSWPFMALIVFLMVSNDLLKKYYVRSLVHTSVTFFLFFSYLVLLFPYVFRAMGPALFVAGGAASLVCMFLYLRLLSRIALSIRTQEKIMRRIVIAIALLMNGLYFANIIPPIPLSLRVAGVYYSVQKDPERGQYRLVAQAYSLFDRLRFYRPVSSDGAVYVFSAVFAPTDLSTTIAHRWQYYDTDKKTWTDSAVLAFPLSGGRREGYRVYSSRAVFPGLWRVDIETSRGQMLGRVRFRVTQSGGPPPPLRVEWK